MSLINDALKRARQARTERQTNRAPEAKLHPAEGRPKRAVALPVFAGIFGVVALVAAGWLFWKAGQPPITQPATNAVASSPASVVPEPESATTSEPVASVTPVPPPVSEPVPEQEDVAGTAPGDAASVPAAPVDATPLEPAVVDAVAAQPDAAKGDAVEPDADAVAQTAQTNAPALPPASQPDEAAPAATAPAPDSPSIAADASAELLPKPTPRPVQFPELKLQGVYYRLKKPSVLINNRTLYVGDQVEGARVVEIKRYSAKLEFRGQTNDFSLR